MENFTPKQKLSLNNNNKKIRWCLLLSCLSSTICILHSALWCWGQESANQILALPEAPCNTLPIEGTRRRPGSCGRENGLSPFCLFLVSFQKAFCEFVVAMTVTLVTLKSSLQIFQQVRTSFMVYQCRDTNPSWSAPLRED